MEEENVRLKQISANLEHELNNNYMVIDEVTSGLTGAVSSINSKLKDSMSFLNDIKEAGWEKVSTLVNEVLGLEPLIEVAGFSMKEFQVEAGIPPGIILSFLKEKDVDAGTIDSLLEQNKDKEILKLIVQALQKADALQKQMKLSDYKFRGLNMKIALPPVVNLKFSKV